MGKFFGYIYRVKLEFSSKELSYNYAKKNNIDFEIIEPKKKKNC